MNDLFKRRLAVQVLIVKGEEKGKESIHPYSFHAMGSDLLYEGSLNPWYVYVSVSRRNGNRLPVGKRH